MRVDNASFYFRGLECCGFWLVGDGDLGRKSYLGLAEISSVVCTLLNLRMEDAGWFVCIASAKSQSAREASHHPAFMDSFLTIGHMCLPCLPSRWVNCYMFSTPHSHSEAMTIFKTWWVWFKSYGELVLFWGMNIEFKDKIMLHCFLEMKCQQVFTTEIGY